jgi:phage-related protein (TIGR01555 family)
MGVIDRTLASFVAAARTRLIGPDPVPPSVAATYPHAHAASVADVVDNPNVLSQANRGLFGELLYSTSALYNAVTGAGTSRDASFYNQWAVARPLRRSELYGMGRNGLIVQALSKLPNTATREGWRVDITDESVEEKGKVSDQIAAYEARLGIGHKSARALTKGRQYGEALVVLLVDDGRPMSEPVDVTNIRTIRWAADIDVRYYQPATLYQAESEKFGQVEKFRITDVNGFLEDGLRYGPNSLSFLTASLDAERRNNSGGEIIVHADRVMHFPTVDYLPLLDTLQDSLGGFFESMNGIRTAARESSVVVYKIKSWLRKMWSENAALAQNHMRFVDAAKSSMNAWVLDDENEDVSITSRSLGGLSELANPFMVWLGAALAMPQTILFGVSPGGFGKGEAEIETWHNEARAYFNAAVAPQLFPLHGYILAAKDGCNLPFDTQREVEINDLSPPDETTRSKLRTDALSDIRQLVKDDIITRAEARPAVAALADDYFRPEVDLDAQDDAPLAPVGVFTGSVALMQALYPTGIPVAAGRELMQALASTYFTPENTPRIFPEVAAPASVPAPAPTSGVLGTPAPDDIEDDETTAEPNEVDVAWSQNPLPSDGMDAAAIAAEFSIPTVRVTRAHRAGLIEGWNVLGGKPRYSLQEVRRVVLQGNGKMPSPAQATTEPEPVVDANPRSLCIAIKLPPEFALWVPHKSVEPSPAHVTLLYVKDVDPAELDAVLAEMHETFCEMTPFHVTHSGVVGYFDTPAGKSARVAYAETSFSVDSQALFDDLADGVAAFGLEPARHGEQYVPHTTLAYLADPHATYTGPVPKGTWQVVEAVAWYGDEEIDAFPLQGGGVEVESVHDRATTPEGESVTATYWLWQTQRDGHVRPAHKRLQGRRFREGVKHPTQGEPGSAPNCRCAKQIYVPPGSTRRAHEASTRAVRRALIRNYKRITEPALKRAAQAAKRDDERP